MERPLPRGVGLTALSVADARARESARPDRLFDDAFAQLFVDAAGAEFAPPSTANAIDIRAARAGYVAIRTRFFDDELRAACAAGCRQVVLLAAVMPQVPRPADPSIADPAAWLAGHGWQSHIYDVAERFRAYGRATPMMFSPAAANMPARRLATATRL
jgi:O-methyltransferase involved in polyketide biosynthesis